jgi:glycosyltransferase involved in cell wall biosynthesis
VKPGTALHQWATGASTGDAITTYALALQEMIRRRGYDSDLFADYRHVSFDMRRSCRDLRAFPDGLPGGSTVIYHFSIGSDLTEKFLRLPPGVRRVISYHNITPPQYFRALLPEAAAVLEEGRRQLRLLSAGADLAMGVSRYNCAELEEAGSPRTAVVPLVWERPDILEEPDPAVLSLYGDRAVNWLFVGRVAPNKKLEDLIKAFAWYRRHVFPNARLFCVGSFAGVERYYSYLRALTVQLDLPGVIFTGHVTAAQLTAYYRLAHVMVCMSEHEGFCLPLVEAMSFGVPVVAFAAAAVPETVAGGGIVFSRKDYPQVAELVHLAVKEGEVRERLIAAGRERLEAFSIATVENSLWEALKPLLA